MKKSFLVFLSLLAVLSCGRPAMSGNPLWNGEWYADPEVAVFDGKYWIYPTWSKPFKEQLFLDCFSSDDLVTWTKHEKIITQDNIPELNEALWAPSVIEKDGMYYLYFSINNFPRGGDPGGICVAVASSPQGPYGKAEIIIGEVINGAQPIDQFVFRDDDGSYYMYYGGWKHCNMMKMGDDLKSFVPFEDGTMVKEVTPESYVEGPFMLKRNGKYYFMWSEGKWTKDDYRVAYAIADSPFGGINKMLKDGASCNLIYCGGVNYPAENTQATSTAPGWCSILTGAWADSHKITGNGITKELEPKTLMTSLIEEKVIDDAAFITKWKGHFSRNNATYNIEKAYCEDNSIDVDFNLRSGKKDIHTGAMAEVTSADCADFVFIIYENTDSAGHDFGFTYNNPAYKDGFRTEDAYAYEVIKAIEARDTYKSEDWLIIITSDHGGINTDHGGASIQERMTFVIMNREWK